MSTTTRPAPDPRRSRSPIRRDLPCRMFQANCVTLEGVGRLPFALFVTLVVTVGVVHPAVAQDSSVAERLFREGKKLMGEKKYAEACKAFEGSYRKDAAVTTL